IRRSTSRRPIRCSRANPPMQRSAPTSRRRPPTPSSRRARTSTAPASRKRPCRSLPEATNEIRDRVDRRALRRSRVRATRLGAMTVATKRPADPSTVAQDTADHVLVSWSAQAGLKPLVITGGQGSWLHAGDRRILDFSSGLINVNLGHGYPSVVRAIQEQAEKVCYVTPSFAEESRAKLARLLAEVTPGDLSKTIFTTGGSEANEHAIKIARLYTRRHKI